MRGARLNGLLIVCPSRRQGYPGAWMFMTMAALNFVTILMMLVWWRTLVPHPDYRADVPATSGAKTDDEQNPRIN